MPKIGIGPNKVSIDPKAYAARITRAKKIVAMTDPATKAKINEMYPAVKKEAIVKKALEPKKTKEQVAADRKKRMNAEMNAFGKTRTPSKGVKKPMPKIGAKPKPLTGPAAVAEIQRRTSPAGVKKAEMDAKKATNKKYPGLYKTPASKKTTKPSDKTAPKPKTVKPTPMETTRVGGIFSVPKKPKKTIY